MPTITFRLTDTEHHQLHQDTIQAGARTPSQYIRETLQLRRQTPDLQTQLDALSTRLDRLEQIAGEPTP